MRRTRHGVWRAALGALFLSALVSLGLLAGPAMAGTATNVTVQLSPSLIAADGTSTTTATATVTDAQNQPVAGETITFTPSDNAVQVGSVTDHGDGTYTATL